MSYSSDKFYSFSPKEKKKMELKPMHTVCPKSFAILGSISQYQNGQDFLDIQYDRLTTKQTNIYPPSS